MIRVAIYARVSTTNKNQDLDTQLFPLKEYCKNKGLEIYNIYTDEVSGSKEKRPALDELISDSYKGKIDLVLVYRFDRFARSTKHLINSLELFNSLGIQFVSYQENIDTSTPTGKVMFTMISAFAEFERSIISERVKSGMEKAKIKGKSIGRPTIELDSSKVKEMRNKGYSIRRIGKELNISKSSIYNYLS